MIGNMETLRQHSSLWRKVDQILRSHGNIVNQIEFTCDTHKQVISIKHKDDFVKSPLGGCDALCDTWLTCGHVCHLPCHVSTIRHTCDAPCNKLCHNNKHKCNKKCDQLCGPCMVQEDVELPCGHLVSVPCSSRKDNIICSQISETILKCGHVLNIKCGEQLISSELVCEAKCEEKLECGHICGLQCHGEDGNHQQTCKQPCSRSICPRQHPCPKKCHEPCPPCQETFTVTLPCSHEATLFCTEDVDSYECTHRCSRILDCGHPCKYLCHEPCGPCHIRVEGVLLPCGHRVSGPCGNLPPCQEPVQAGLESSCHHVAMVPCHLAASGNHVMESPPVQQQCNQTCDILMSCGQHAEGRRSAQCNI